MDLKSFCEHIVRETKRQEERWRLDKPAAEGEWIVWIVLFGIMLIAVLSIAGVIG